MYLKATCFAICFVHHFQIHVEFGSYGGINHAFETLFKEARKCGGQVQVRDGNSDLSVVQFLQELGIEFGKDRGAVGYQEPTSTLRRLLEANKGRVRSRSLRSRFAV